MFMLANDASTFSRSSTCHDELYKSFLTFNKSKYFSDIKGRNGSFWPWLFILNMHLMALVNKVFLSSIVRKKRFIIMN